MLTVGISSRALFDINDGHRIYVEQGSKAFDAYMQEHERKPLRKGVAFNLVKKLLSLNAGCDKPRVRVLLLSSNSLNAGARVMASVRHYGLDIETAIFTAGGNRFQIAKAIDLHLFLTTNPNEVRKALDLGIASATVQPFSKVSADADAPLCIAFDCDAVVASDAAEVIHQEQGLAAFQLHEQSNANVPLGDGPFKPVLQQLCKIQGELAQSEDPDMAKFIRIAIVTARGTPAYERVVTTLRAWNLHVDETLFCGGLPKGPFLFALGADLFLDDGLHNIESAQAFVPSGHVPYGIVGSR
ncbi:5'-nucleotidase [Comamonas thiooxydans]|uniref:5'-nucleotidase n=1 Tax=Comamonas thiooxydans TaxID=363952 RepID=UPI000B409F3F|nr:5'-nucleotidase [Comamonas thiooxydans]